MSISLNVPSAPSQTPSGPTDVWELVPVSDITTQQGAINLYEVQFGGMMSIQVDGTNCNADLLLQFFLQNSPVGQPFLYMMWANQRHILRFDSPIQSILISNATGTFVLPAFMAPLLPYRNPSNTTGFLLLSAQDSSVQVDGISNPVHIGGTVTVAGNVNAAQSGSWDVGQSGSWNVGPAANFPVVNPANSQLVVSRPYIEQGTFGYTAPVTAHNVGPVTIPANVTGLALGNASGDTITITVQGATSNLIYYSASLGPNELGLAALPLGGFENVNVLVTDSGTGSRSIYYGFVYDTTTIVPQNWGNGALSITPATGSTLTAQPGSSAASSLREAVASGSFAHNVLGSSFATPSELYGASFSVDVTTLSGTGLAATGQFSAKAYFVIETTTVANQGTQRIILAVRSGVDINRGASATWGNVSFTGDIVFPFPLQVSNFITDANSQLAVYTQASLSAAAIGQIAILSS